MKDDKQLEKDEQAVEPTDAQKIAAPSEEQYSLNDDRRVKVLSPGMMVAKRFFRNRLAMVGLFILIAMFLFSFVGGLISPYDEDQLFYRTTILKKDYASAKINTDYRFATTEGYTLDGLTQAQFLVKRSSGKNGKGAWVDASGSTPAHYENVYEVNGKYFWHQSEGTDLYSIYETDGTKDGADTMVGFAYKDVVTVSAETDGTFDAFAFQFAAVKAYANGVASFTPAGATEEYALTGDGVITLDGEEFGYVSRYVVQALLPDVVLTREFKEQFIDVIEENQATGEATLEVETDEEGVTLEYFFTKNPNTGVWSIRQEQESRIYDTYASPSKAHWLGTDGNGMDMLTRLMYGGRVSLIIGFVVEIISTVLGVILGGISGYFGGWVDNLIMRIVDIFYCIPSLPIFIILGAAMDNLGVPPKIRMLYLMLILGFLGWPVIARLVRGQILSLREQEFMTATEACGISAHRRIFKHLVPNVIPQLIVSCTMGLGGTILTEATLSFLGLGVRFPFASWGNIITDVNNTFVLTNFWFIWIPAGTLLLLTVLAFNILGDGLRDAFDPKMKR
ncbi:MAG: ABC transporter permease [Clostridia bacterium]|nr:ABC transporter permease [Clostridia bacterium]